MSSSGKNSTVANMRCVTCKRLARKSGWPTIWQMLRQLKFEGWNTVYKVCPSCVDNMDRWRENPPLRLRRRRGRNR